MDLHFSDYFNVSEEVLREHGAFDVSVVSDLPLFVDPFLLFNSDKPEYQDLHEGILRYMAFLRDKAASVDLDDGLIDNLYRFKEVKQNWLGFTVLGNSGSGLGSGFARALHEALGSVLADFGRESVTRSSHIEKVGLVRAGVGRDNISDFTTNLIKEFLCEFTQSFALTHLRPNQVDEFPVERVRFNYGTETWETRRYRLPDLRGDFILLTPYDILTRHDTWINHGDMVKRFPRLPSAVSNETLRAQINHYFRSQLPARPSAQDKDRAAAETIRHFPELMDHYIRLKEESGERASSVSAERVQDTERVFVARLRALVSELQDLTRFYNLPQSSLQEAMDRVSHFKDYIENNDGYRLISKRGKPPSSEKDVQLFFGLVFYGTEFDVNREVDNGRGPVDFKVSMGAADSTLIEFKLGSNSRLRRNLEKQVQVYKAANRTPNALKVIVCYTRAQQARVKRILSELGLLNDPYVIVIDARHDNKPSGSKA